jgi:hypothetical protein
MTYKAECLVAKQPTCSDLLFQYEYRPDRKWCWLQRVCLWILNKIGAFSQQVTNTYGVVTIEHERLASFVRDLQRSARRNGEPSPHRILMGWRTVEQFIQGEEGRDFFRHQVSFGVPSYRPRYKRAEFCGMEIFCVPWFADGTVVLPSQYL